MSTAQAKVYLTKYLGVSNFIWLEGVTDQDIIDAHIDGMARFYDEKTLLTVSDEDFFELYEGRKIVPIDVTALYQYGGMLHCVTQQQPVQ